MGEFIGEVIIKKLVLANKIVSKSRVVILGLTFKENCPDSRNSKVMDIIKKLSEYGITPIVVDPEADIKETKENYDIDLIPLDQVKNADCLVFAVAHDAFKEMSVPDIDKLFIDGPRNEKVIIDVKSIFDKQILEAHGYQLWRL